MYAAIRQGKGKAGMAEELAHRIKEGAIPIIRFSAIQTCVEQWLDLRRRPPFAVSTSDGSVRPDGTVYDLDIKRLSSTLRGYSGQATEWLMLADSGLAALECATA